MQVVYQGEPGAYSEAAVYKMFGSGCRAVPLREFEAVFEAVGKGRAQRGAIPIENSLTGSILENYDRLQRTKLNIVAETRLRIEHVLMCHACASSGTIKEVLSHPQALSQCSRFFNRRKRYTPSAYYDTAGAAKSVAARKSPLLAAVASSHAAKIYDLKILKRNLENNHQNYTRFIGISRRPNPKNQKGALKSSIFFAPKKDETGVLFKMAGVFALRNVNLLKIESRPNPRRAFHYLFYLDFEGSPAEKRVERAMEHLKEMSSVFQYFGSYPIGKRTYID